MKMVTFCLQGRCHEYFLFLTESSCWGMHRQKFHHNLWPNPTKGIQLVHRCNLNTKLHNQKRKHTMFRSLDFYARKVFEIFQIRT